MQQRHRRWILGAGLVCALALGASPARADGPSRKQRLGVTLGLAGASLAAAGAGTYFLLSAEQAKSELRDLPRAPAGTPCLYYASSTCAALADARARESTHRAVVAPLYVGAGLLAAGAALAFFLWPTASASQPSARGPARTVRIVPTMGRSFAGALWTVGF